jgi:hypothetical protein
VVKPIKILTFDEFADELLAEQQPRALVILASSQIDIQLRNLIESFFWPKTSKTKDPDELLDGDTPLSTFSSRIKLCARLGLIDTALMNALNQLRTIRNMAAHWTVFGISESPLKEELRKFKALITARTSYQLTVDKFYGDDPLSDFQSFQACLLNISVLLASIETEVPNRALPLTQTIITLD